VKTILTNCTVIDCTGKPPKEDMTIVIEGGKIAELKPGICREAARERERVFDLEGGYVLPGLWNVHVHLSELLPDTQRRMGRESAIECAIRCGRNAMDALRLGVTGMRVVGERDYIDVAWKRAFDAGVFVGPRLFVCGGGISPDTQDIDGPYGVRKAVRERIKRGADQIKLIVSGGHGDMIRTGVAESMQVTKLLQDEVEAAVKVAHQKGKRVCVHTGNPGMKMAIRAGVDCIEHGYWMDDEAVELMVENDVFYDPTLVCNLDEQFMLDSGGVDKFHAGRALVARSERVTPEYAKVHLEGFQKALKAGVKICCGGDSNPSGEFALMEIEHLARAGMGEMGALIAATRNCADLCEVGDELGTVEVGKLADLIVLAANPLEDVSNIRKLKLVFKGGDLVDTSVPEGLGDFWELFFDLEGPAGGRRHPSLG
jgi:imidazolonepropionase-like amidohydrolase